ncbi:MAG: VOC family protein [Chloroflexi bacterium]|nr:VOC family protein [Chloroflexota bacterium]
MPHHGLEHFGFDVVDMQAEITRLQSLGAELLEGPVAGPTGNKMAWIKAPDDTRIELIQPPA